MNPYEWTISLKPGLGKVYEGIVWWGEYQEYKRLLGYIKNGHQTGTVYTDSWLLSIDEPVSNNELKLW